MCPERISDQLQRKKKKNEEENSGRTKEKKLCLTNREREREVLRKEKTTDITRSTSNKFFGFYIVVGDVGRV